MDWDRLRIFHAVAQAGSFTHAGETLNLSQSSVSRQISQLEESLTVRLFHRHARGLILTEQGDILYRTVQDVFAKLATTESLITEGRERATGHLRVTTTIAFGATWLAPRLGTFLERYPDITLSLLVSDDELDLSMREADVAIRMSPPRQPDLIQRPLRTIGFHLYAAAAYLKRHGMPRELTDLAEHRLIVYGDGATQPFPNANWLLELVAGLERPASATFNINNYYGIYRAVESGIGIAALPDFYARDDFNVVRILENIEGPPVQTYFVYPEELRKSKKVTVLRDFLIDEVVRAAL